MRKILLIALSFLSFGFCYAQQTIDLAGEWRFVMGDKPEYNDKIQLPGSMITNNKGDIITVDTKWTGSLYDSSFYFNPYMEKYRKAGEMKFPFFLTPPKHYVGNAWYQKTVFVPKTWKKQRIYLYLERPHIETTVFVNGQVAGRDSSLSVPHEFDVTPYIIYGKDNVIAVKVYNGAENVCVGLDSHSVTDQTQGNWNGIAGKISLTARPQTHIKNVQIYPRLSDMSIEVKLQMANANKKQKATFIITPYHYGSKQEAPVFTKDILLSSANGEVQNVRLENLDLRLWNEFTPNLYTLTAIVGKDTVNTVFGMRDIKIEGYDFYVNGVKTYMRGTLDCCCFPLTGYPPTDVESWLTIFRKCKEYGLNQMRFHSYCPPEAAFMAADIVGFYLQPEGPSWPNHGVRLRRGMSIDRYLLEETERMVEYYGNHPSFAMLAAGNEPAGDWVAWCNDFVKHWQQTGDRRRVYCGASVGGGWAWDDGSEFHVKGGARGLNWERRAPQSNDDFYDQILRPRNYRGKDVNTSPILTHELGQWCAFPDFKEISQYTGAYKAGNFEIFRDLLRDNGMGEMAEKFLMASGKLQTLAYKYDIERNLRTKDYAGFQLLGLNDYSGQGSALVGVLNVFWREKGYCTAADWTQFCSAIVPLAKFPKFVYTNNETLTVPVELYNAYCEPLKSARSVYTITSDNGVVGASLISEKDIPVGKNHEIGTVSLPLSDITHPQKLRLTVSTQSANAPLAVNSWEFWVYPAEVVMPETAGIHITDTLDEAAKKVLADGGKVLIEAAGKVRFGNDIKQNYLPIFWNTSWFKMRPPHTTGSYIANEHPLFRSFPTDNWSNLNWWELLNKAQVMNLSEFPASYQSPIQTIDTWHISRKIGMLVEANVGKGKLLMTTMDISRNLDNRPVARQMRKAILEYMNGSDFNPQLSIDNQLITNLFEKEAPKVDMFTKDSPDELKPKIK